MRKLFAFTSALLVGMAGCEDVVDPDPGDPTNLSYAPCIGSSDNPTWFAVQDGDGAWQRVTATSGAFNFTISSGRGGIAMYTAGDGLFVVYATTEEFEANLPKCDGASVRTVAGSVTGYATADNLNLAMGTASASVFGTQTPPASWSMSEVDATVTDLVGVRYRTSSSATVAFQAFPNNIFIRRGVSGTTTGVVDFGSSTEAGAPLLRSVNVTNVAVGEELGVYSNVALSTTLANVAVWEASPAIISGSMIADFYGVPASRLSSGESHMLLVTALRTVSSSTEESRFMTNVFTDPTDRSMTFGPALGTVTVTGSSRPTASYAVQAGYDNLWDVIFAQGNGSTFRQAEVLATKSYLGSASGTVTLSVPDLGGVSGFSSSWLLTPGVSSVWTFLATSADMSVLNQKAITYQGADRTSTFTP